MTFNVECLEIFKQVKNFVLVTEDPSILCNEVLIYMKDHTFDYLKIITGDIEKAILEYSEKKHVKGKVVCFS